MLEGQDCSAPVWKDAVHPGGEDNGHEEDGHTASSARKKNDGYWCSDHFLLSPFFSSLGPQPIGCCCPHSGWAFPPQLNCSRNTPVDMPRAFPHPVDMPRAPGRHAHPLKLALKINYQSCGHRGIVGCMCPSKRAAEVHLSLSVLLC